MHMRIMMNAGNTKVCCAALFGGGQRLKNNRKMVIVMLGQYFGWGNKATTLNTGLY